MAWHRDKGRDQSYILAIIRTQMQLSCNNWTSLGKHLVLYCRVISIIWSADSFTGCKSLDELYSARVNPIR